MKKALAILFGSLMLSAGTLFAASGYWGDFKVPTDRAGVAAQNINECGVYPASVRYSSQPFLLVSGSSIAVYGVLTSTKSVASLGVNAFVQLRSTNTANLLSELLVPPIAFSSDTQNTLIEYDPPIICLDGLSVNITTVSDAMVTVFYRYLSTTNEQDYWIPYDKNGVKAHNPSFYGIRAASGATAGGTALDGIGHDGLDFTALEKMVLNASTYQATSNTPGLLIGVVAGSHTVNQIADYVVFRDTGTIGETSDSTIMLPPIFYNNFNLEDALLNIGAIAKSVSSSQVIKLPWPVIYSKGLSQKRSASTQTFRVMTRPSDRLR